MEVREESGRVAVFRGVSAAIKHVADRILEATGYQGLPPDSPRLRDLRRAFYRLAQVGEEGQFTRRIARKSGMPASCAEVLKRFIDQRLLVSGADHGEETLSVTHEALFRVWDTLRQWLVLDRKALRLRARDRGRGLRMGRPAAGRESPLAGGAGHGRRGRDRAERRVPR